MRVSLIITVLNEGGSIRRLMDSIAAQTRLPDEVVICDGGSTDSTAAIIQEYADRLPLRLISRPGANISQGRNAAIAASSCGVVAVTDAGVWLPPDWLAHLIAPFEAQPACQVVAGFFLSDPQSPFEVAMGATVLPELRDIDPRTFMPSSRSVAFRREAVLQVGGYPEWLDFCEDLILDFRLHRTAGPFCFAPDAVVHFRPRSTLRTFWKQYYQYARGDGKANLFFRRHIIRYLTYLVALPAIIAAGVLISGWALLALLPGGAFMFGTPYRRLVRQWGWLPAGHKAAAAAWVPVIRISGDIAKMVGYPAGVAWRWRHRPPDWRRMPGTGHEPRSGVK
jgi:glycosyltransferase involved in cell wall biosynthesis